LTVTCGKAKVGAAVMVGVSVMVGVRVIVGVNVIVEVNVASGVGVNVGVDVSVGGRGVGVIACKGRLQARINKTNTSNGKTLFFI
jgi:hypothetical protein